ncbi:menaquinone biosynthesis protein [Alteribacillus sp. HJP-4]|uniref:menaquinone biosynthesis protein n=1 Tax=Alteribacillus sp. HJP-4 TaxID=2775394 RepID=UPI0035CD345D
MTLRVGEISYSNILPLFFYMDREYLKTLGCNFIPKVPSGLNEDMKNETIDVGGISSFAYGASADMYKVLPGMSVSSYGKVGSIFLFSKKNIEELADTKILLTSASATSVHLLKAILREFYDLENIEFEVAEPDFDTMKSASDAFLLIGDDAIRSLWRSDRHLYRYDLGQLWYEFTGLPMTFALMTVRKQTTEEQPEILLALQKEMLRSKQIAIGTNYRDMIASVRQSVGGSVSFWEDYFQTLFYDFNKKEKDGLLYYYRLMYKHGYFKQQVLDIDMWNAGNEVQYLF